MGNAVENSSVTNCEIDTKPLRYRPHRKRLKFSEEDGRGQVDAPIRGIPDGVEGRREGVCNRVSMRRGLKSSSNLLTFIEDSGCAAPR